ncbi:hypothetical protein HKX48_007447 [Thoreauomyces humboldtii]|nr:hypothetical protein HKX48_007447 [Thoreauomyces humboldtii]
MAPLSLPSARSLALYVALGAASVVAKAASHNDDFDDDEEDDYLPGEVKSSLPDASGAGAQVVEHPRYYWSDVTLADVKYEAIIMSALLTYVIAFFIVRTMNNRISRSWLTATKGVWDRNFSKVMDDYVGEGPRSYVFYATGRQYVQNVYGRLRLAPRYDPFDMLWNLALGSSSPSYDKMTLTATLNGEESDAMVLAIILKEHVKKVNANRWDVSEFPKKREVTSRVGGTFPSQYTALADAPEFINMLWEDADVRKGLWASLGLDSNGKGEAFTYPLIEQLILTDLPIEKPTKMEDLENVSKTLTMVLRLPTLNTLNDRESAALIDITEMFMTIIDYIGQFGLSTLQPETRSKITRVRQAASASILKAAEAERKEALAKKKFEEKRARDQEATKLSPEEQRKYEEKERKKLAKRNLAKQGKKGKMSL